jgi:hypothetical protein
LAARGGAIPLRKLLAPEHIKSRLLGHWSTTPGQNFVYARLSRDINKYDLDIIYIAGPGYGGSALIANTYLEMTQGGSRIGSRTGTSLKPPISGMFTSTVATGAPLCARMRRRKARISCGPGLALPHRYRISRSLR